MLQPQQIDEVDVACFLHAYVAGNGGFSITGTGDLVHRLKGRIEGPPTPLLLLELEDGKEAAFELSERLGLPIGNGESREKSRLSAGLPEADFPSLLMTADGYSAAQLAALISAILLTPEEDLVLEILRLIDFDLRIALVGDGSRTRSISQKLGVFVLLRRPAQGAARQFGRRRLAAPDDRSSLVKVANGILLVDEIDTGLHHTVLEGMWRLVLEAAARRNVQIFATTHSDRLLEGPRSGPRSRKWQPR